MKRFFSKYRLPAIAIILAALVVVIDRLTEQAVALYLQDSKGFIEITSFFNLVWTGNDGVSFGMLQGLEHGKWLLSALALLITGFFFIWLLRTQSLWVSVALGLIIGGALGNTFERLAYGHVIDILDFHAYGYHWPAFNLTDSAIVSGVTLLMFYELFKAPEHQKIRGTNNG
jgi:signal peptidase II